MDLSYLTPSRAVLEEFCASGELMRISGGQGNTWKCGSLVLKPLDMPVEALEWMDHSVRALLDVQTEILRISLPLRTRSGGLIYENWTAFPVLEGTHLERRWPEIIEAGYGFSDLLDSLECPPFIQNRQDPWAIADRAAWGEQEVEGLSSVHHIGRLCAAMRPVHGHSQLIHGDLTGNVLFHSMLPPAVIDLTFYWRPKAYAAAVVVVDALCFERADQSLLDSAEAQHSNSTDQDDFVQYVLRALVFRISTDFLRGDEQLGSNQDPYTETVDIVCSRVERGYEPKDVQDGTVK